MKKIAIILVSLFSVMALNAQTEHIKFMGIPLDGTISIFQGKLATKELKPDAKFNASSPVGTRMFKGNFAGNKANVYVYYDKKTKLVYRAKACISNTDEKISEQVYNELKQLLDKKYKGDKVVGEQDGHETYSIFLETGWISLFVSKYPDFYPDTYVLHIDYNDRANTVIYEKSQLDDI